ncbi:MAG: hypothetical protein ACE5JS_21760, partial [Nitrospinota bacterium]
MNGAEMEAVTQRLDRLERENRQLKLAGAAALALAVAFATAGATSQPKFVKTDTVETKFLVVTDSQGNTRASIDTSREGSPRLHFFDVSGKRRVSLRAHGDETEFSLSQGKSMKIVLGNTLGKMGLALWDGKWIRAELSTDGLLGPELRLKDAKGKERVKLTGHMPTTDPLLKGEWADLQTEIFRDKFGPSVILTEEAGMLRAVL